MNDNDNMQKWRNTVLGTDEEIKNAIKILNRQPVSFRELNKVIFEEDSRKLDKSYEIRFNGMAH